MSIARKELPKQSINYLAIGGGGYRSMYAQAVMEEFDRRHMLKDVEGIAATSGGCMAGFLMALGYTPQQSIEFLRRHVFEGRFSIPAFFIKEHVHAKSHYYPLTRQDGFFKSAMKLVANLMIAPFHCVEIGFNLVRNIFDAFLSQGLLHPKGFEIVLLKLIEESPILPKHLKKIDLTFQELHDFRVQYKKKFPDYPIADPYFVVTEKTPLNELRRKVFSHKLTPGESIVNAACASMAIPYIFRTMGKRGELYDGGVVSNVPVDVFDESERNMRTAAVYFASSKEIIQKLRDKKESAVSKPQSRIDQFSNMAVTYMFGGKKLCEKQEREAAENADRTIFLDCSKMPSMRLTSISEKDFSEACATAANDVKEFLDRPKIKLS